ncbi:glutaredoxin family protein [Salinicoccus sp. CNSTN-B1]
MSHLEPTVYIQDTCLHCHRQIDWMEQKGYAFVTKEVSNPEHREGFFQQGGTGTPLTVAIAPDGEVTLVQGFQRQELENLLEEKN